MKTKTKKIISKKIFTVTLIEHPNGDATIETTNKGYTRMELVGILEKVKLDVLNSIK